MKSRDYAAVSASSTLPDSPVAAQARAPQPDPGGAQRPAGMPASRLIGAPEASRTTTATYRVRSTKVIGTGRGEDTDTTADDPAALDCATAIDAALSATSSATLLLRCWCHRGRSPLNHRKRCRFPTSNACPARGDGSAS